VFLVPFGRSLVPIPYGAVPVLFKFRLRVEFFYFRISAYSELTLRVDLGFSPSPEEL
jgi:hypothetical protein